MFKPERVLGFNNFDLKEHSDNFFTLNDLPSLAVQSQAEEADINTIVRRFGLTGQLPENVRTPTYGDFTEVFDFHSAQNAIRAATESFDRMPPVVRERFKNDAGAFVDFCSNPDNMEEMRKMGLAVKKENVDVQSGSSKVVGGSGEPSSGQPGADPKGVGSGKAA